MTGNDQVRFCDHCSLHVTDLSSMTRSDALRFVERSRGRVCVRYIVRPDGVMVTRKMPEKLYRIGRRASRLAAGAFSATLAVATAGAQTRTARPEQSPSTIEHIATPTIEPTFDEISPSVSGTITNPDGRPLGDVLVVLVDRDTGEERNTTTSSNGEFVFQYVPSADYLIWARKRGFDSELDKAAVEHGGVRKDMILTEKVRNYGFNGGALALPELPQMHPLAKAVADDDLAAVRALAFATSDINAITSNGVPLLNQAVERGNREMAQVLMRAGADVNLRSDSGRTAIMSLSGKTSVEIVQDLIDGGARINARDDGGDSVLMIAAASATHEVLKQLLKAGARADATNSFGQTVLFDAVRSNSNEAIDLLVAAGVDINTKDDEGQTALMTALFGIEFEVFKLLVAKGAEVNLTDDLGQTPLILAAGNEDERIVESLLLMGANIDVKDSDGTTALMLAAETERTKNLTLLIRAGASLEMKDEEGRTALLRAAFNGSAEVIEVLLAAGADVTARDKEGKNVLKLAREAENEEVVSFLKNRRGH